MELYKVGTFTSEARNAKLSDLIGMSGRFLKLSKLWGEDPHFGGISG